MNAKSETEAKVIARNRLNSQVNEIAPKILEVLKNFLNKKVIIGGNNLSAQLTKALEPFLGWQKIYPNLQIYRNNSNHSISFVFKTSEQVGEFSCTYQEEYVYLGNLSGQTLNELGIFEPRRTNYDLNEVLAARSEIAALENQISNLSSKLTHFGRF